MENLGNPGDRTDPAPVKPVPSEGRTPHTGEQRTSILPVWRRALLRPDAWGVVIAAMALLLSQLPPILNLARGTSVELNMGATAFVTTHVIGRPQLSVLVGLANTGGRPSTTTRFSCNLTHVESSKKWTLEVNSGMRASPNPGQRVESYPLGWIPTRAGELWSGVILCDSVTSDDDLRTLDELRERFNRNLQDAMRSRIFPTQDPVRVSDELSNEAIRRFDQRFDLLEGTYELRIEATLADDRGVAAATRCFQVTPYSISQLHGLKGEIQYGAGILFPSTRGEAMVRLTPVDTQGCGAQGQ